MIEAGMYVLMHLEHYYMPLDSFVHGAYIQAYVIAFSVSSTCLFTGSMTSL